MYHGWNDVAISPQNSIDYYTSVLAKMGRNQSDFIRLFMVPGMGHCQGGPGPDQINYMSALERWREAGEAPASLTATRVVGNRVDMTRPLCAYPQVATYKGTGSTNDAANFVCNRSARGCRAEWDCNSDHGGQRIGMRNRLLCTSCFT